MRSRLYLRSYVVVQVVLLAVAMTACGGTSRSRPVTQSYVASGTVAPAASCQPTNADALGPYYETNAPTRDTVGTGYVLSGFVRSSTDCEPVLGAQIELWLANPQGEYDDAHRATVQSSASGEYRFESHRPPAYGGRPPHIHLRVSAPGYDTVVTQHYPADGPEANLDLVLVSE